MGAGVAVAAGAALQKVEQGVLGLQPGAFVLHVDEMTGVAHGGELAVGQVRGEQACVGG